MGLLHNGYLLYLTTGDAIFEPDIHSCEMTVRRAYFTDGLTETNQVTSEIHEIRPTYSNLNESLVSRYQELIIID